MSPDTQPKPKKSYAAFIAAVLVGLIIIGGCGYLIWKTRMAKTPSTQPDQTVAQIQKEFALPANFKPTFRPPRPTIGQPPTIQAEAVNLNTNWGASSNPAILSPRGPAVANAQ